MPASIRNFWVPAVAAVFSLSCGSVNAQPYPSRPIHLVVPFSPGGGVDIISRLVAQRLTERLGQNVVIDNRAGAGGIVGTGMVAKAAPDGYSLVMVSSTHGTNPSLYRKLPYDTLKDFAPVSLLALAPGIMASPKAGARSVKEFIELARAKPGQITFSSAGSGSSGRLGMELLQATTGVKLIHVPYKGAADLMSDLVGGRIDVTISSISSTLPIVKGGKLNGLGVTSKVRVAAAPDLPTIAEAGVPGYESTSWYAMFAPAGTPGPIINRLNSEIVRALGMDEVRERLIAQGMQPVGSTPQELGKRTGEELVKWRRIIRAAGIEEE